MAGPIALEEPEAANSEARSAGFPATRVGIALVLAVIALAACIVAAVGPAVHEESLYRWPPHEFPQRQPGKAWYTPLLLANRIPAWIDVTIPCKLPHALKTAGTPVTVVATARNPERVDGLRIMLAQNRLSISVGQHRLAYVSWPQHRACPLAVRVAKGKLELPNRTIEVRSSYPDEMPTVSALFSELDLRNKEGLKVAVKTRTYATSPTPKQVASATASVVLALGALLLVLPTLSLRALAAHVRGSFGRALRSADLSDAVVVLFLMFWLVVAPANVDDGWVWIRQRTFPDIGTFANYFETHGATLPLDYWLEWLQHWITSTWDDIAFQRIPSLAALLACWLIARFCLRKAVGQKEPRAVRWTLLSVFALLTAAWDMTLRPEPFVCLLVGTCLACVISFASSPRLSPLVLAMLATVLAVTAHPEGVIALAPLLVVSPQILRWLRGVRYRLVRFSTAALSSGVVGVVLLFLDTDLETWVQNRQLFDINYTGTPWLFEPARYRDLLQVEWWATPMRVASVAVLWLVVLAYLTRRRTSTESAMLAVPAESLAVALLLMTFDPSKSPYHFGTLAVLGAVAAGAECTRFLNSASTPGRQLLRPFLAVALVALAFVASLSAKGFWNPLDLQTRTWKHPVLLGWNVFDQKLWLAVTALALGAVILVGFRRETNSSSSRRSLSPANIAAWSMPVAAATLIVLTSSVMIADAVKAKWALPRQDLAALFGSDGCGLADAVRIPRGVGSSYRTGKPLADSLKEPGVRTLLEPAEAPYFPCADTPTLRNGLVEVPDLIVGWELDPWPATQPASPFRGISDLYALRLLYHDRRDLAVHEIRTEVPGGVLLPAIRSSS